MKSYLFLEVFSHCRWQFFLYQYDIWEAKIETIPWAWNIAQRILKCERPIFAQGLGCIQQRS